MENNIYNDYDWEYLASPGARDERQIIEIGAFTKVHERFVEKLNRLVNQELHVLTAEARMLADGYYRFNKQMREKGGKENQGYYGTRVRIVGKNLSIVWHLNHFVPDKYTVGKKNVISEHLKKGSSLTYSKFAFRKAKAWELEAILDVEKQYGELRRRAKALAKIRRALTEHMKPCDVESPNFSADVLTLD